MSLPPDHRMPATLILLDHTWVVSTAKTTVLQGFQPLWSGGRTWQAEVPCSTVMSLTLLQSETHQSTSNHADRGALCHGACHAVVQQACAAAFEYLLEMMPSQIGQGWSPSMIDCAQPVPANSRGGSCQTGHNHLVSDQKYELKSTACWLMPADI